MSPWYISVNAGDIPNNPLGEDGMEAVINLCGIGGFAGFFVILLLAMHTIYFILLKNNGAIKPKFLYFELVILTLFMASGLAMGLLRCDAIIVGDFNVIGCIMGWYLEVLPYMIGKLGIYLLFVYRVKCIFRGSPFEMGTRIKYVLAVGVFCYVWIFVCTIIHIPVNVDIWIWVYAGDVKMCVVQQSDPSFWYSFLVYTFTGVPLVDFIFGGYLFVFFIQRLRMIRFKMIELNLVNTTHISSTHTSPTDTSQTSAVHTTVEMAVDEKNKKKTNTEITNTLSDSDKKMIQNIEALVKKQSILMGVALFTTLSTVTWMWILPMISNLLVYDGVINSLCVHLIFGFCNPFWRKLQKLCSC